VQGKPRPRGNPRAPVEPGTPGEYELDEPDDPEERARQACLRLLTLAPRTRAQLAQALARQGIPGDVADAVLGRFTDAGLIDDAAFARAWVESRHYSRGLAGRALGAELKRRGVGDDEIREAVGTLGPDEEVSMARRLVQQRLVGTRGLRPEVRVRRLAAMLARKGYPAGLVFRVIREALEAEGADLAVLGDDSAALEDSVTGEAGETGDDMDLQIWTD
jgi:regulatory protein